MVTANEQHQRENRNRFSQTLSLAGTLVYINVVVGFILIIVERDFPQEEDDINPNNESKAPNDEI